MNQQQQQQGNTSSEHAAVASSEEPSHQTTEFGVANVVDPMDVDEDGPQKISSNNHSDDHSIGGSSISEISAPKSPDNLTIMMINDHPQAIKAAAAITKPPPIPQAAGISSSSSIPKSHLARADSRNSTDSSFGRQSSQTSDYGWFEDVHPEGSTTPRLKRSKATDMVALSDEPMMEPAAAKAPPKEKGLSLLPHLTLAGDSSSDEMQQVLLDPPLDLETGKFLPYVSYFVGVLTSCLGGTHT